MSSGNARAPQLSQRVLAITSSPSLRALVEAIVRPNDVMFAAADSLARLYGMAHVAALIVVDIREYSDDIIALVRLLRNYSGAPIVGLVSRLGNTPYQDLIDIGLTDVVRIDRDDELLVVQAHANDETRSGARALTVRRITGILPPVSLTDR